MRTGELRWSDVTSVSREYRYAESLVDAPAQQGAVDGVVCLFAPDGSLTLSLPEDPERVWVGFSDPVQWY